MGSLIVSEVFGPTVQGEGPSAGRVASFVRLGLCNLDCNWCDTPYTWDWTGKNGPPQNRGALFHMTAEQIADELEAKGAPLTVITGGEPMIQQTRLTDLLPLLGDVEIETNGTLAPVGPMYCRFNVSPKLASSGVKWEQARQAMENFIPQPLAAFKFVVADGHDLAQVDELAALYPIEPSRIWVMPEGRTREQVLAGSLPLAEQAIERGYNFSTRLHVLLWNDERGR